MSGVVDVEKPQLPEEDDRGKSIAADACKASRSIYWSHDWIDAQILDLEKLHAGNLVIGPAVVESPSSTMLVPPGRSARLDRNRIFHMNTTSAFGKEQA